MISNRAIASLAVTIPSVYYLIQPQVERYSGKKAGHGGHGEHGHGGSDEHGEEHSEESTSGEDGGAAEGEGEDSPENTNSDGGLEEGKEDTDSGDNSEGAEEQSGSEDSNDGGANKSGPDTPSDKGSDSDAHETDSGKNVEGVQFKGATSGGSKDGEQGDTRKHIPDAKGGSKKRIESDYGNKLGEAQNSEQDASGDDMVCLKCLCDIHRCGLLKGI